MMPTFEKKMNLILGLQMHLLINMIFLSDKVSFFEHFEMDVKAGILQLHSVSLGNYFQVNFSLLCSAVL